MTPQEALEILGAIVSQVRSLESARHPHEDADPRPRQALEALRCALQDARREALEEAARRSCLGCQNGTPLKDDPVLGLVHCPERSRPGQCWAAAIHRMLQEGQGATDHER